MKNLIWIISLLAALMSSQQAMATGSAGHSGQAVVHSVQASGHAVLGSAQLVSASVAIPLQIAGAIGAVSGQAGDALMEQANADFNKPLTITNETITAGPSPDEALYGVGRQ